MAKKLKTVGIVGGKGLIGTFFAKVFANAGFIVLTSDKNTATTNQELIKRSDIVAFSVPLHKTPEIVRQLAPYARPDQLLIDFASIKMPAVNAMLKSEASVIGLHPMFRPSKNGLKGQNIVMCPARASKQTCALIRKIFIDQGANVTTMSAKKHDKLMAIVQVLIHSRAVVFGNVLRNLKINIGDTIKCMSPVYRLEFDLMGRIFAQSPELYAAIITQNPEGARVLEAVEKENKKLMKMVQNKDMQSFLLDFIKTSKYLGPHKERALHESNRILTAFPYLM